MTKTRLTERRGGMTLTELLVVIVILGLLMVTAIPVLVPSDERTGREAALTFTSAIARAKKRAVRSGENAAVWLDAIDDDVESPNATRLKCADLFVAETPSRYPTPSALAHVFEVRRNPFNGGGVPLAPREYRVIFDKGAIDTTVFERLFPTEKVHRVIVSGDEYLFRAITPPAHGLSPNKPIPIPSSNSPPTDVVNLYPINFLNRLDSEHADPPVDKGYDPPTSFPPGGINADKATCANGNGILTGQLFTRPNSLDSIHQTAGSNFEDPTNTGHWGETIQFEQPLRKSPTPPLSLPGNFVIDMTWSCLNGQLFCHSPPEDHTHRPSTFVPNGKVLFGSTNVFCLPNFSAFNDVNRDRVRGPAEAMQSVHVIFDPSGEVKYVEYPRNDGFGLYYFRWDLLPGDTLCFLIGRADRAGNGWVADPQTTPGANWQYGDSRWVSIQQNGTVSISNTIVDATQVDDAMADALAGIRASRY